MPNSLTPSSDDIFHYFISTSLDGLLAEHQAINPENNILLLFHRCVAEVPAYRQFLEVRGVKPAEITSFSAFQALPLMGKADYMQAYRLTERCLGGSLKGSDRVAVSSGSTGQPTFWPRSVLHELDVALRFEHATRWLWFASRWATGWAVCTRHPAAGIWHARVIR